MKYFFKILLINLLLCSLSNHIDLFAQRNKRGKTQKIEWTPFLDKEVEVYTVYSSIKNNVDTKKHLICPYYNKYLGYLFFSEIVVHIKNKNFLEEESNAKFIKLENGLFSTYTETKEVFQSMENADVIKTQFIIGSSYSGENIYTVALISDPNQQLISLNLNFYKYNYIELLDTWVINNPNIIRTFKFNPNTFNGYYHVAINSNVEHDNSEWIYISKSSDDLNNSLDIFEYDPKSENLIPLTRKINTPKYDELIPSISVIDGKKIMFFSRATKNIIAIYMSVFENNNWSSPIMLDARINSTYFTAYFNMISETEGFYITEDKTYSEIKSFKITEKKKPEENNLNITENDIVSNENKPASEIYKDEIDKCKNALMSEIKKEVFKIQKKSEFMGVSEVLREVKGNKSSIVFEIDELEIEHIPKNMGTILYQFYFDKNSYMIKPNFEPKVTILEYCFKDISDSLSNYSIKIVLDSYTSSEGTIEYNKKLAYNRSHVIKSLLAERGLYPNDIIINAIGEVEDEQNQNLEIMRRVDVRILKSILEKN